MASLAMKVPDLNLVDLESVGEETSAKKENGAATKAENQVVIS